LTAGGLHKVITTDHIPPLNFDTAIVVVVHPIPVPRERVVVAIGYGDVHLSVNWH